MTLKHPQLIKRIIELIELKHSNPKSTAVTKKLLNKNTCGKDRDLDSFHNRLEICYLSFLSGFTRPEMSIAAHQEAKFSLKDKECNDISLQCAINHLLNSTDEGLLIKTHMNEGLEVLVDAAFARVFDTSNAKDPTLVHSRTRFIIKHTDCTIT